MKTILDKMHDAAKKFGGKIIENIEGDLIENDLSVLVVDTPGASNTSLCYQTAEKYDGLVIIASDLHGLAETPVRALLHVHRKRIEMYDDLVPVLVLSYEALRFVDAQSALMTFEQTNNIDTTYRRPFNPTQIQYDTMVNWLYDHFEKHDGIVSQQGDLITIKPHPDNTQLTIRVQLNKGYVSFEQGSYVVAILLHKFPTVKDMQDMLLQLLHWLWEPEGVVDGVDPTQTMSDELMFILYDIFDADRDTEL